MASGGYEGPVTKVELYISCTKLVNKDTFSKSDPFAVLFENKGGPRKSSDIGWIQLDKTEVIYDNLNPKVRPWIYKMHIKLMALHATICKVPL